MRCPCCYEEYEGSKCPVCDFENVQIVGDYDEGMKQIQPMIDAHRLKYLGDHNIGIRLMKRKDTGSSEITAAPENLFFGKASDLIGVDKWLDNSIVAYPDSNGLVNVEVITTIRNKERCLKVGLPGLKKEGIIGLGVRVNDDFSFCIKMKNDNKVVGVSQPLQLWK